MRQAEHPPQRTRHQAGIHQHNLESVIVFLPSGLLITAFVLRVIAELRSGQWEGDADYLMYVADQWLRGSPPWLREFDDKLPLTYILFLPAAILRSIRPYQLQSAAITILGGICVALTLQKSACLYLVESKKARKSVAMFVASIYCYSIAIMPGSITSINATSASFFIAGLSILLGPDCMLGLRLNPLTRMIIASIFVSAASSLRPYYGAAALLIILWPALRKKRRISSILLAVFGWACLLITSGIALNILPSLQIGSLDPLFAGLTILTQKIIPSHAPDLIKRQLSDVLNSTDLTFLSLGSLIMAPCFAFFLYSKDWTFRSIDRKPSLINQQIFIDLIFTCIILPVSILILILKKHYYPHYLQFFIPFGSLSTGFLLSMIIYYLAPINKTALSRLLILASIIILAMLRLDIYSTTKSLAEPLLDRRSAEYATLLNNKRSAEILRNGFLYPESMSLHWRLGMPRNGFANAYSLDLIAGGTWEKLRIPKYYDLPSNSKDLCRRLRIKGGPTILTKTDWIKDCLTHDPEKHYRPGPTVDHSLIDVAIRSENIKPYRLELFIRNTILLP